MRLDDVNRGIHKHKKRTRVGRGPGSGHGKTAGRGNKGQGQLAGWSAAAIFQGGQMPLVRRIPKRGFNNRFAKNVAVVNVGDLEAAFDAGAEVSIDSIRELGLVKGRFDLLKVLGDGELKKKLTVSAHRFSASARQKIEQAGGKVNLVSAPGMPAPTEG
jgi:large subunit ribosomal protein L15